MFLSHISKFQFLIVITFLLFSLVTHAKPKKVALIIGNSNYESLPLKNPVNDAKDMSEQLKSYGFQVNRLLDADLRAMKKAIRQFGKDLNQKDTIGLFFFAGHGLQIKNRNYLVPIGANVESESEVEFETIDAGRILGQMDDAQNELNLMILDACRNNPFKGSFRSASRGLAKMQAPTGSVILYATSPGTVAADGEGKNGLFTEKLISNMKQPGLKIEDVFKQTAIAVSSHSNRKQVPYFEGVVLGDFYFRESKSYSSATNSTINNGNDKKSIIDKEKLEISFWKSVEETPNYIDGYKAYLSSYPDGHYKHLAKFKISQLNNKKLTYSERIKRTVNNASKSEPLGLEFADVKAGCFKMGSQSGEKSETPAHRVCISKDYKIAKYEVTQAQWQKIMGSNPSKFKKGANHPVEQVSWYDAKTFIQRLNTRYGGGYRLPTEAEWEYACRSEGQDREHCTHQSIRTQSNDNWDAGHSRVGTQDPNDLGLYDMDSNVREWVADWFNESYYSQSKNKDPLGPGNGNLRSVRGGSWMSDIDSKKAQSRFRARPESKYFFIGLRLAKDI